MNAVIDVDLAYGTNERIARKVGEILVNVTDGPELEFVASFLPDPQIPIRQAQQATKLAIHMDPEVAGALYAQLRDTFEAMGWPLPAEGIGQALGQTSVTDGPHATPRHTRIQLSPDRFRRRR